MATAAPSPALAAQARRVYLEMVLRELPRVVQVVANRARDLISQTTTPDQLGKRRDLAMDLPRLAPGWLQALNTGVRAAAMPANGSGTTPMRPLREARPLALVDDDTIDIEIIASRLALALMDKASWEFSDLRYRIGSLERRDELDTQDALRPHVLARTVVDAWRGAGLSLDHWRTAQQVLQDEFAALVQEGYHEANRWLMTQGVCPEVNLRPFIRRSRDAGQTKAAPLNRPTGPGNGVTEAAAGPATKPGQPRERYPTPGGVMQGPLPSNNPDLFAPTVMAGLPPSAQPPASRWGGASAPDTLGRGGGARAMVHEETRLMTRSPGMMRGSEHAEAVLGRLNRLISRQVADFAGSTVAQPHPAASPGLKNAINAAQVAMQQRFDGRRTGVAGGAPDAAAATGGAAVAVSTPALLQELQQRKQALKQAASTPVERATIEVVALMFQSLLTEERIPASVRVWFARLQMPVLRVAIAEPDFFATIDHPARKLIDRMGACAMGFEAGSGAGINEPLEKEIKRVVQVVEAYPDTGRRVFQTVLTEFERFLENYFKNDHAASRKGVSLAQQIEQREALAIQYTIEMRKMLDQVPVHDGVRDFLFHVWADVLATTAVQAGQASDATKKMHRVAADLIWMASAKVTREERSEAIRRLPPLLKLLREGMGKAGVPQAKQDEYIQALNNSLAAAFSARTATIPTERLEELMMQLETLEDLLPDIENLEIDESMVRDLSDFESNDMEVVSEGGSMPTPAMIGWVGELQVGAWFKLDYRNKIEPVQLAWQGMHKQLLLFVTPQGRGIMFQRYRLASFLQAGLLVPVEEESLTVRATRDALAKLDADPDRLLH
ncbi:MAG: DUF1631 family protein [Burkholderiales bacterium]